MARNVCTLQDDSIYGHPDPLLISDTLPSTSVPQLFPLPPVVEGASVNLKCGVGESTVLGIALGPHL